MRHNASFEGLACETVEAELVIFKDAYVLLVKLKSHTNLIDPSIYLTFKNKSYEQFLDFFHCHIQLLPKKISLPNSELKETPNPGKEG